MRVILSRRQEKLVKKGYPWIFANQIHRTEGDPVRGSVVEVRGADGTYYGQGLYHDSSQIAVRLLTHEASVSIDEGFFRKRIQEAVDLRKNLFGSDTAYRLAFSESDGLPGTIIDRYGDVLTWSTLSFGMDDRKEMFFRILEEVVQPTCIVERNDSNLRLKDALPESRGVVRGNYPDSIIIKEGDLEIEVDVLNGPKTGYFLDQRLHRKAVAMFAHGKKVLDVFCADGGFGLHAARAGAASVSFVDVSDGALQRVRANAERNTPNVPVNLIRADALEWVGSDAHVGGDFDLVVLDPPAFAKSRRQIEFAVSAYQRINITALQQLPVGGILATSSCSQAIDEATFLKILRYSARKAGAAIRILYRGFQPPDHPVLDAMPETHYLKFYILQKIAAVKPATTEEIEL